LNLKIKISDYILKRTPPVYIHPPGSVLLRHLGEIIGFPNSIDLRIKKIVLKELSGDEKP